MALIGWILRTLAILFVVRIVLSFLAGLTRGPAASGSARRSSRPAAEPRTREGGHLVRDPHCGTYVPIARAISQGSGGSTIYFCSEDCRRAWAERKAG